MYALASWGLKRKSVKCCDVFEGGICIFSFNLISLGYYEEDNNASISMLIQLVLIEHLCCVRYHARYCDGHKSELAFKEHVLSNEGKAGLSL